MNTPIIRALESAQIIATTGEAHSYGGAFRARRLEVNGERWLSNSTDGGAVGLAGAQSVEIDALAARVLGPLTGRALDFEGYPIESAVVHPVQVTEGDLVEIAAASWRALVAAQVRRLRAEADRVERSPYAALVGAGTSQINRAPELHGAATRAGVAGRFYWNASAGLVPSDR